MLTPIRLEDLQRAPQRTRILEFKQFFPEFDSLIPVEGRVRIAHRGHFLEAEAWANTIVTLTCHRCLQQFNHRLQLHFEEILMIEAVSEADLPQDMEIEPEDLTERIAPWDAFDVQDWIYQHLHLGVPPRLACEGNCPGMGVTATEEPLPDPRWAALRSLQQQEG